MTEPILTLINKDHVNPTKLHELITKMNTVDIAESFDTLSKEKTVQVFRLLPKDLSADVFSYLDPDQQQIIVEALTDAEVGTVMEDLFMDDAVDFIEEMPANVVKRVLQSVNEDKRKLINQLLQYPDDSTGSIMTTEYVDLKEDATVREAFDMIRATGVNRETIYTGYVIRRDRLLVGVVSAKTLLLAKPHERIGDIMETKLVFAHTTDDQEKTAGLFKRYGLLSLPVVDKEQRLVGIVTVDDIVQIIEAETTEDFEKMAALTPADEPYLKDSVFRQSRNRIPWLLFLMLSATITGAILTGFEESLAAVPVLMVFIPMLMDTGGNAGSQSATLIIRGVALGEIQCKDIGRVLWREIRVGLICGLVLSAVNFLRVFIMNGQDYMLCLTVTVSLLATVVVSKSVGCTLPLIAKKVKLDPAIMAAPIITTLVDGASLFVYFSVAKMIMRF